MSRRRYRLLSTDVETLLRLIVTGHRFVVHEGLPQKTKLIRVGYAPGDRLGIVLENQEWPPVEVPPDPNDLPRVVTTIAEVIPGPKLKMRHPKTGEEREVQSYLQRNDVEGEGAAPPPPPPANPRVVLAGAGDLGQVRAKIAGACPTCGRAGGPN